MKDRRKDSGGLLFVSKVACSLDLAARQQNSPATRLTAPCVEKSCHFKQATGLKPVMSLNVNDIC